MKPNRKLAETAVPGGARLALYEHDGAFAIRMDGRQLMTSVMHESERVLGELATAHLGHRENPRILVGGLGLGFSLAGVLQQVGPRAMVEVAELVPEIVRWNREYLQSLNGALLNDPRVAVRTDDVWDLLVPRRGGRYDAVLLDTDNGPVAMVQKRNARLYAPSGIKRLMDALRPGARAAIWSANRDQSFERNLNRAGFRVVVVPAKLYAAARRQAVTIYLADKPGGPAIGLPDSGEANPVS